VTSDRQFDKEGRWNFREKAKKRRTTFLERELEDFIKINRISS